MRNLLLLLVSVLLSSCSSNPPEKPDYFEFDNGEKLAELKDKKLKEASGLAASRVNTGMFWTHNDSGNKANVFLIDKSLTIKMFCTLKGVDNRDWEDIAVGPGPDPFRTYVYVADIGDNIGRYNYKIIYRFPEPELSKSKTDMIIEDFDTIVFSLPDERKDAETLMIDPVSKDLFTVSKREQPVTVYRIPFTSKSSDTLIAKKISVINTTDIVAGDISSDGKEVLIKNIDNIFYWKKDNEESFEQMFLRKPKILPYEREAQGEAIAFSSSGDAYYTLSEKPSGEKSFLIRYKRKISQE